MNDRGGAGRICRAVALGLKMEPLGAGAGPCYRCLFPEPPAPDGCSRCSDAGVLGPVPGFIGCLQVQPLWLP